MLKRVQEENVDLPVTKRFMTIIGKLLYTHLIGLKNTCKHHSKLILKMYVAVTIRLFKLNILIEFIILLFQFIVTIKSIKHVINVQFPRQLTAEVCLSS